MCYHASVPSRAELDKLFENRIRTEEWDETYHYLNGYQHKPIPILKAEEPTKISKNRWGLVASWAKDATTADMLRKGCLNAKSEEIWEKASYRNLIKNKRCLIFLNGIYEWRHVTTKDKYPYLISIKNQNAFACGGVYETWKDKATGEVRETCSIITTAANPLMAKIHNSGLRMPLIFTKENMFDWIEQGLERPQIDAMMKPLEESFMEAHTVVKINPKTPDIFNIPEVKAEVEYPQIILLDT